MSFMPTKKNKKDENGRRKKGLSEAGGCEEREDEEALGKCESQGTLKGDANEIRRLEKRWEANPKG